MNKLRHCHPMYIDIITSLSPYVYRQSERNLLSSNMSSICLLHNMANFGPLTAEKRWRVWGTPANFNVFRVLAALLHDTLVVGVSQTLRRWTEGAIYIRQGGHDVGHWPTFLVLLNWLCAAFLTVCRLLLQCLFNFSVVSWAYTYPSTHSHLNQL